MLRRLTACAFVALSSASCRAPADPDPDTLPVVELRPKREGDRGYAISRGELRSALARLRLQRADASATLPPELVNHVVDTLLETELLRREAERLGVGASTTAVAREWSAIGAAYAKDELARALTANYLTPQELKATIAARLTADAVIRREVLDAIEVTESDVREAHAQLSASGRRQGARVRARQIVLESKEEADRVRRALQRGADFATLARTLSVGVEADRGGDLGWITDAEMPEVFKTACFSQQPGSLSEVTPSPFGYHICEVLERAAPRERSLEELRPELTSKLLAEKRNLARSRYVDALRARFDVVRHPERMKLEN